MSSCESQSISCPSAALTTPLRYILPTFSSYEMDNVGVHIHMACAVYTLMQYPGQWMFFVQFAVEAFSDLAVAIALAFFLMRGRNSSMSRYAYLRTVDAGCLLTVPPVSRTSSIINTLLVYTVNTGFLTA